MGCKCRTIQYSDHPSLKLDVQSERRNQDGTRVAIVAGIGDLLQAGRKVSPAPKVKRIVRPFRLAMTLRDPEKGASGLPSRSHSELCCRGARSLKQSQS